MQIILLETIQGLGKLGETVEVKAGYARNFLLPKGKALMATKENMAKFEAQKAELEKTMAFAKEEAEKNSIALEGRKVSLSRSASETGQLYGSVKARDIAAELEAMSINISRSQIMIGEPIKMIGEHEVKVALHPEVIVKLPVEVSRQSA